MPASLMPLSQIELVLTPLFLSIYLQMHGDNPMLFTEMFALSQDVDPATGGGVPNAFHVANQVFRLSIV